MPHTSTYPVKGMHCASCSYTIQKALKKIPGVQEAEVNYGTETAKVTFDEQSANPEQFASTVKDLGYTLVLPKPTPVMQHAGHNMAGEDHSMHTGVNESKQEKLQELAKLRGHIWTLLPLAIFSIVVMTWDVLITVGTLPEMPYTLKEFIHHLLPILATYTLFVVGKPYLVGVYRFIRHGRANMDTLIGIGTSVAFIYSFLITAFEDVFKPYLDVEHTYYDVTIVVIAFITLGKFLEARSKLRTGDAIEKLLNLQAKTALVIRDGKEMDIPVDQVVHGDLIKIKPGTKIPVDGVVTEGSSYVDEATVTGEPTPVEKTTGDTVVSGTLNTNGVFTFKATKVGSETFLANIIKMVQNAQGSKAPIQGLADKVSAIFVPTVLIIAAVTLTIWLVAGSPILGFSQALSYGLLCFIGILVIACPCALGLATPTAIIVGVGHGASEGILIKDAATLEKLAAVQIVALDKTGTITAGKPQVVTAADDTAMALLTSLERNSEHPLAHAIFTYAKEHHLPLSTVTNFTSHKGKGVQGAIDGKTYFAGNSQFMKDNDVTFDETSITEATKKGQTPVLLASEGKVIGTVMIADVIKPNAKESIDALHALGLKTILLTGDHENTAHAIAQEVGIDTVKAGVLPEDKLNYIKELQKNGQRIAMIGDGVNDAPALAQSDVGVAMGTGTDVAIESAGITLLHGDLSKLVRAIRLSRATLRGIKQNLFWAFIYNMIGIPLAAGVFFPLFGWLLSPVFAGAAMALSSVSVISNSLRLKRVKL
ncbi:MAG: heavy metal translocating P-type ATPase [Candidatus Kerfeldbacteria bacterium]|nr:heavy metal translocating P-type ATPase [Candidatus Kerfeldbacteria bacterium]